MWAFTPHPRSARWCFALTALLVAVGIAMQVVVAANGHDAHFTTATARVLNVFAYFTIQSNLLVGLGCLLLAIKPDRWSPAFAWLRMTGLVSITITFVVYQVLLADYGALHGWRLAADLVVHWIVPLASVGGWLIFGPRGLTARHLAPLTILYPACWLAFTLARGPIADFYPYPFVDVDANGYPRVLLNSAVIGLLVIGLAAVALRIDAVLARRSTDLRERFRRLGSWRDRLHGARPEDRPELLRAFGFTRKEIARLAQHDRLYEMCALLGGCLSNATYDEVGIVAWFRACRGLRRRTVLARPAPRRPLDPPAAAPRNGERSALRRRPPYMPRYSAEYHPRIGGPAAFGVRGETEFVECFHLGTQTADNVPR